MLLPLATFLERSVFLHIHVHIHVHIFLHNIACSRVCFHEICVCLVGSVCVYLLILYRMDCVCGEVVCGMADHAFYCDY